MRRKKLIELLVASGAIIGILFFFTAVFAHGWGPAMMGGRTSGPGSMMNGQNMMGGGMMGPNMMYGGMMNGMMGNWQNVPEQYRLTPEQNQSFKDIREEYKPKILPLNRELRATQMELWGYEARPQTDMGKIREYHNKIFDLEKNIDDYRLEARERMYKILTEDQKAYWGSNVSLFGENWCPMMSGNMMGWSDSSNSMMNGFGWGGM